MSDIVSKVLSKNFYSREEAKKLLSSRKWFQNSDASIQKAVFELPERSDGFVNDLADRTDSFGDFEIIRISNLNYSRPFVFCTFDVKSTFTGKIYQKVVASWDKGAFHSMKGIILLECDGKISHFLLRNTESFSTSKVLSECLGSIYPPENFRSGDRLPVIYLESEIKKMLRLPEVKIDKCIDLGQVYPDQSMSDNIVSLYAAVVKTNSVNEFSRYIEDKKYDDRDYSFTFTLKPIGELLDFLSQTQDSFILAIFGRLQALNVIKL